MKKKTICLFLILSFAFAMAIPCSAASVDEYDAMPNAYTTSYYELRNKSYIGTTTSVNQYLTSYWAMADSYEYSGSTTAECYFYTSTSDGTFPYSTVNSLTSGYTKYKSATFSNFSISADSSRYSRLAVKQQFYKYYAELYYVTVSGETTVSSYKGSGYFYVPSSLYAAVVYQ